MQYSHFDRHRLYALKSDELREAERFFEWALSYERKGLQIAADAMRDEGRKAFKRFLATSRRLAQA
jgi:hypothetical protein